MLINAAAIDVLIVLNVRYFLFIIECRGEIMGFVLLFS